MLTEGLWRPDLRRSWVVGEVRRWVVAGLTEIGRNGVAPGPWTPWIGVGLLGIPLTCGGGLWRKFGTSRALGRGERGRGVFWCQGGAVAGSGRGVAHLGR